jgi:hypothetical protein
MSPTSKHSSSSGTSRLLLITLKSMALPYKTSNSLGYMEEDAPYKFKKKKRQTCK